jgi:hypothetical protein
MCWSFYKRYYKDARFSHQEPVRPFVGIKASNMAHRPIKWDPTEVAFESVYSLRTAYFGKRLQPYTSRTVPNGRLFFFLFVQHPPVGQFTGFLDLTQRRITVGVTPLDKWSARRRDLYMPTHNTHKRQTSIPHKPVQHVTVLNTIGSCNTMYYNIILQDYNLIGTPPYMRSVVDLNVIRCIPVLQCTRST